MNPTTATGDRMEPTAFLDAVVAALRVLLPDGATVVRDPRFAEHHYSGHYVKVNGEHCVFEFRRRGSFGTLRVALESMSRLRYGGRLREKSIAYKGTPAQAEKLARDLFLVAQQKAADRREQRQLADDSRARVERERRLAATARDAALSLRVDDPNAENATRVVLDLRLSTSGMSDAEACALALDVTETLAALRAKFASASQATGWKIRAVRRATGETWLAFDGAAFADRADADREARGCSEQWGEEIEFVVVPCVLD